MELVSATKSTLNPDAPVYIPVVSRQLEDFSPEWWQSVTASTWYREYWLSQHQDDYDLLHSAENDVAGLLPNTFDVEPADDLLSLEAQFEVFVRWSEAQEATDEPTACQCYSLS